MAEKIEHIGLGTLKPPQGSTHAPKRKGRGPGSGHGKTSGHGHKGQKARTGGHVRPGFEGGQMPLIRRVPKRGFTNIFRTEYTVVNLDSLAKIGKKEIELKDLVASGLIKRETERVKLLADGDAPQGLVVKGLKVSAAAKAKIEAAGGRIEE